MATEVDPICHMDVDVSNPPGGESRRQGITYYFCAPGCKVAFDRDPEKYLQGLAAPPGKRKPFLTRLFGRGA
jgi:YHS domain-containing protein